MSNEIAPPGKTWVCCACGKRSRDRYGFQAISGGWDESCMLNADLFDDADLVLSGDDPGARVVEVRPRTPPSQPGATPPQRDGAERPEALCETKPPSTEGDDR